MNRLNRKEFTIGLSIIKFMIKKVKTYLNKDNLILILCLGSLIINFIVYTKLTHIKSNVEEATFYSIEAANNAYEAKTYSEDALEYAKQAADNAEEAVEYAKEAADNADEAAYHAWMSN